MDDLERFLDAHPECVGVPWGNLIRSGVYRRWQALDELARALGDLFETSGLLNLLQHIIDWIGRQINNWHGWRQ